MSSHNNLSWSRESRPGRGSKASQKPPAFGRAPAPEQRWGSRATTSEPPSGPRWGPQSTPPSLGTVSEPVSSAAEADEKTASGPVAVAPATPGTIPAGLDPPLEREWDVLVSDGDGAAPRRLISFSRVRPMWGVLNYSSGPNSFSRGGACFAWPTKLHLGAEISICLHGTEPRWEDKANKNGGRWTYLVHDGGGAFSRADSSWLRLVLMLAGETLDPARSVSAIVAAKRAEKRTQREFLRFSVWTVEKEDAAANLRIGKTAQTAFPDVLFEYQDHGAAYVGYRYVLSPLTQKS